MKRRIFKTTYQFSRVDLAPSWFSMYLHIRPFRVGCCYGIPVSPIYLWRRYYHNPLGGSGLFALSGLSLKSGRKQELRGKKYQLCVRMRGKATR